MSQQLAASPRKNLFDGRQPVQAKTPTTHENLYEIADVTDKAADAKIGFLKEIPVGDITTNKRYQPRKSMSVESIKRMAESISAEGLQNPPHVIKNPDAPGKYILIAGHRRLEGVKLLGKVSVTCFVRTPRRPEILALLDNEGEDLNPVDNAEYLDFLKGEFQLSDEKLAAICGYKRSTLTELLAINRLPQDFRDEVRRLPVERIRKSTLLELAKVDDAKLQKRLSTRFLRESIPVKEARDARHGKPAAPDGRTDTFKLVITLSGPDRTTPQWRIQIQHLLKHRVDPQDLKEALRAAIHQVDKALAQQADKA